MDVQVSTTITIELTQHEAQELRNILAHIGASETAYHLGNQLDVCGIEWEHDADATADPYGEQALVRRVRG